jgi:hypothetical protein
MTRYVLFDNPLSTLQNPVELSKIRTEHLPSVDVGTGSALCALHMLSISIIFHRTDSLPSADVGRRNVPSALNNCTTNYNRLSHRVALIPQHVSHGADVNGGNKLLLLTMPFCHMLDADMLR